jgi:hypothetical protein
MCTRRAKGVEKGVGRRCSLFFCFVAPAFGADSHSRCIGPISPGRRRACSTAPPSQRRSAGKSTPGERVGEKRRRKNRTALSRSPRSLHKHIYKCGWQEKERKEMEFTRGCRSLALSVMLTGRAFAERRFPTIGWIFPIEPKPIAPIGSQ